MTGADVVYFAFPYGQHVNLNRDGFAIARRAGMAGVCSAYGGYNFPGADPFHLQRIHGDPDMTRWKNWVHFDPRKHAMTEPFVYDCRPRRQLEDQTLVGAAV